MVSKIRIDNSKCDGCFLCELACSYNHTGECRPSHAAIKVNMNDKTGEGKLLVCMQCKNANCIKVCPETALERNEFGVITVNYEKCKGCKACMQACPFHAIGYDVRTGKIFKCDMCGGSPKCTEICPAGAIRLETLNK